MRIYLAGPMRGLPDNNGPAFAEAAAHLRSLGHEVWSPAEHDQGTDVSGWTMTQFMQRDLPALLQQEAVVLLDDWARSHGACLERHLADVVGMPVFFYAPTMGNGMVRLSGHDWRWRAA